MTANTTPQESQEDYGDLLLGLEDGDLNDFDGLDDFGDDLDEACEQMHRSQKEAVNWNGKLAVSWRKLTLQVMKRHRKTPSSMVTHYLPRLGSLRDMDDLSLRLPVPP